MRQHYWDREVEVPENWLDLSRVVLAGPETGGFRPSFVVTREEVEEGLLLDEAMEDYLQGMSEQFKGVHVHSANPASMGENAGALLDVSSEDEDGAVHQLIFLIVSENQLFTLVFTDSAEGLKSSRVLAEHMFASFKTAS